MKIMSPFGKLKTPQLSEHTRLYFNLKNAKMKGTKTAAFSLPAGYTCPGACKCLAWVDRTTRKLKDGDEAEFRCFAATLEAAFTSVRKSVDKNFTLVKNAKTVEAMAHLIDRDLPSKFYENIRVHADGDFFHQNYFLAWMEVARRNPERVFYAYTKSLPIWTRLRKMVPENFVLTASIGGKFDHLIEEFDLKRARVVFHPDEAEKLGIPVDHSDELARDPSIKEFALLLHGQQKAGSDAMQALKRMKQEEIDYSYPVTKK